MRKCGKWPVGLTSWSYGKPIREFVSICSALEVDRAQIQLAPALKGDRDWLQVVKDSGLVVTSTMLNYDWDDYTSHETIRRSCGITPDEHWEEARDIFERAVAMTVELKSPRILLHLGYVDHTNERTYPMFLERTRVIADLAKAGGVEILLETGMESGAELRRFIEEMNHPALKVNFDPANLMSYQKDTPLNALPILAPYVREVHAKDTIPSPEPGHWASEQVWGDGVVNGYYFLHELERLGFEGSLMIEREKGKDPVRDAALALRRLEAYAHK